MNFREDMETSVLADLNGTADLPIQNTWLAFIYLTRWSFMLETVYWIVATIVSYWALPQSADDDRRDYDRLPGQPTDLPPSVRLMYLLWVVAMPLSITVAFAYWTLIDPIWHLNPYVKINFFVFTMHFFNAVLFICELCLNRIPFHFKHATLFYVYALAYGIFSFICFELRIGVPPWLPCRSYRLKEYDSLRDCPIYGVLDWHRPGFALFIILMVLVAATLVSFLVWCATRARNRSDRELAAI